MARRKRIHLANGFYHVTLRGNHLQPLFESDGDRHLLNAIVARAIERYETRVHAYCWMTNHLHFLMQVGASPLGGVMRHIASGYARAFQGKLDTTGHLFERRYFARLVSADSYLLALLRYIHLNPVKAGIAAAPADYPWSSHRAFCGGWREQWLTTDFALSLFGSHRGAAQGAYRKFMEDGDPGWEPEDEDSPLETSLRITEESRVMVAAPSTPGASLDSLITEACQRFGLTPARLLSPTRAPQLVLARGWISREALDRHLATLSDVSRALGRDRATLRHAMRQLAHEGSEAPFRAESGG
jgi:REP element-mobilizing transposase RayT